MSNEIKRYTPIANGTLYGVSVDMETCADGDWVSFKDYIGVCEALNQYRISYHSERRANAQVERELASVRFELEDLKMWFAQAKAQGADVPEELTIIKLDKWRHLK